MPNLTVWNFSLAWLALKTVNNNLAKLKQKGLIEFDTKTVSLTAKGLEAAGPLAERPTSNTAHHKMILQTLSGKKLIQMFELLADGQTRSKDEVAKTLGYADAGQKAFCNVCGALRGKKLAEYPEKHSVRLSDACFVAGRGAE